MSNYPDNFLLANEQQTKPINVVLEIDGLPFAFGLSKTYKRLVYGEPGIKYGDPGLVYGGLIEETGVKSYLSLESSLTLQQRIEPEQGRSSTATLTFILVDKNQEVSQVVSSGGGYLDEILGRAVIVRAGFTTTSYPADYFVVFRGTVSQVLVMSGRISITVTDGNQRRRQAVFKAAKTNLTAPLAASPTPSPLNVNVLSTAGFAVPILGPNAAYDSSVSCFIKIDDEWLSYNATGFVATTFYASRAQRGTAAAAHLLDAEVTNGVELTGNAIDLALKIMLSGWGGPWISNLIPEALGTKIDPAIPATPGAVVLPGNADADIDYGLTIGDYVIVTGSTAGNNGTYQITDIQSSNLGINDVLIVNATFTVELANATLRIAFRSQYDTLPDACGLKLTPRDVDVAKHIELRNLYFFEGTYDLRLFIQSQQVGKDFIEKEIYYPIGGYALTRFGRLSMGVTKPPLAETSLQFINVDNVIGPETMTITRGLNNRRFFNSIQYEYDPTDDGKYQYIVRAIDLDSIESIGQTTLLPIKASGVRDALGGSVLASKTTKALLQRYKRAAYELRLTVNFQTGIQIEAGDVVAVQDNGQLQLLNFDTGERSLGISLFEVIDRTLDLKTGRISLVLLSNVGASYSDRFGTIAPSSRLTGASTSAAVVIQDSYGAVYPGAEYKKWSDYVGLPVYVHDEDWTRLSTSTLIGLDPGNPYRLLLDPALSFTPVAGDILEIAPYPTSDVPTDNQLYKTVHVFLDPTTPVLSGLSATQFTVAGTYLSRFFVGSLVVVHKPNWSSYSPELTVTAIDTNTQTITLSGSMTFTPATGDLIELTGFADKGGPYRIL